MAARAEFLERIREQVRMSPGRFEATSAGRPRHPAAEAEIIRRELAERWPQTLEAFRREFEGVAGCSPRLMMNRAPEAVTICAPYLSA